MASLLRQLVAGPRAPHPEANLDLCYVTDFIVVTSGPSSTYPQRAYRNPTDQLVKFLDTKHGSNWAIWEFRAEGTGYPDSEVYGRVRHYPWPDHHPPPFALVPNIMASMRNWLKDPAVQIHPQGSETTLSDSTTSENSDVNKRVIVVHCKAGKGRSGTMACSYLISEEKWDVEKALQQFTDRRMRSGFGNGVTIPSQLRWIGYVDYWAKHGKMYVERPVEIVEVHAWGLRQGVKVCVQGFIEEGKKIKTFHTFSSDERVIVDPVLPMDKPFATMAGLSSGDHSGKDTPTSVKSVSISDALDPPLTAPTASLIDQSSIPEQPRRSSRKGSETGGKAVIFRPKNRILIPTSNVCLDLERRSKAAYGWTLVTAVAHVWFNVYFEGQMGQNASSPEETDRGVFEIDWDAMDGIKGSSRKGARALDKVAIVWRAIEEKEVKPVVIVEPKLGEPVPEAQPADWSGKKAQAQDDDPNKDLGIRLEAPDSVNVSKASSIKTDHGGESKPAGDDYEDSVRGVKAHGVDPDDVVEAT